jgi:hypothetical protein
MKNESPSEIGSIVNDHIDLLFDGRAKMLVMYFLGMEAKLSLKIVLKNN